MSQVHIEKRTEDFIKLYNFLREQAAFSSNKELATILGMKSVTTISEILARRQNIKPALFQKFLYHFKIQEKPDNSDTNILTEPGKMYATGYSPSITVEKAKAKEQQDATVSPSRQSLEKSIENLTENELRNTAIIERLVTLLEKYYANPGPVLPNPGDHGTAAISQKKGQKTT